ncbi:MAG: hypothetical protein IJ651_00165 [Bacteroidales bacterium]|nr:hypothetical protein [Bacteroidales bacterium]
MRNFLHILPLALLLAGPVLFAQTPVVQADLSVTTKIAPVYFGPNAFPVPDAFPARPAHHWRIEVAGDYYRGSLADGKDYTWDPFVFVEVPLWSRRVSMSFWGPIREWYDMSVPVAQARRLSADKAGKGNDTGDLYVATNVNLLEERRWLPNIMLRAVLKTAAGDDFGRARHYDAPGYYFDAVISKSHWFPEGSFITSVQAGVDFGWLYWQTDNGRQNDARLYGLMAGVDTRAASLYVQWGGYAGWEHDGDSPSVVKARLDAHVTRHVGAFFYFQHGLKDWPFNHYRFGISVNI